MRNGLFSFAAIAMMAPVAAFAGSPSSYGTAQPEFSTSTAAAPIFDGGIYAAPVEAVPARPTDGLYDPNRYGGNAEFGYSQSSACGGVLDGENCLVILNDHMRRVRLDRPAGTILVGNPTIADVTVLGNDTMFVSARSIGSTNIIVLDRDGSEITSYEVFVREPRTKRVTLREGGVRSDYQCAPFCERALTQSDSSGPYGVKAGIVSGDIGLDQTAIGLQSGANPNLQPAAPLAPPPLPLPVGTTPPAQPQAAAGNSGADLANTAAQLAAPGLNAAALFSLPTGGGAVGPLQPPTEAPPPR